MDMSAPGQWPHAGLNQPNGTDETGPRLRSGLPWHGRPALKRGLKGVITAEVGVIAVLLVAVGLHAVPKLTSTTSATVSQVGAATTFESARASTVVTGVPAGTAPGDVLLTFVETRRAATVTCASGAQRILNHTHGSGTRLAACLTMVGQSIPSAVQVRISPKNQVTAVTMAFAGVNPGSAIDVMAASSSTTSPSVTLSGSDLVVFGLGSSGLAAVATAPSGARLQATVNNSAHAQVAAATRSGQQGTAKAGKWSLAPSSLPVAATVALLAAPPAPAPASTSGSSSVTTTAPATSQSSTAPAVVPDTSTTSAPPTTAAPATTAPASTAPPSSASSGTAPSSPPVTWCENGLPTSPYPSAPSGAVTVPAGDNGSFNFSTPNTTYWFAPGTHTLGSGAEGQIQPADGDTYVGADRKSVV